MIALSGSALPGELATRAMDAFGDVLYNLYGSTEVAWATIATPADLRAAPGTAGRPPMGTVVKLLDERRARRCPKGEAGRIFVGNEMIFDGYTGGGGKEIVDGLMSTGDVGHFDAAGRLFVDGRDDEMIVSGGENVFPREVEDLLADHEAIDEAAVVGVPDDEFGQRLKAFVVLREAVAQHIQPLAELIVGHADDGRLDHPVGLDIRRRPRAENTFSPPLIISIIAAVDSHPATDVAGVGPQTSALARHRVALEGTRCWFGDEDAPAETIRTWRPSASSSFRAVAGAARKSRRAWRSSPTPPRWSWAARPGRTRPGPAARRTCHPGSAEPLSGDHLQAARVVARPASPGPDRGSAAAAGTARCAQCWGDR